jgi:hypothetical protein
VDIDYYGGNTVNIPLIAAFGFAKVDLNGELKIPINIDLGGIHFKADFNLNTGDIDFFPISNYFGDRRPGPAPRDVVPPGGGGDGPEDGDNPPPVPNPPPSIPPPPPPPDEDNEDSESVIIGVLVTVNAIASSTTTVLFQDDNPDIHVPNLGFVQFLSPVGRLASGWSSDIPVKNRRHLIPCPWPFGAIKVTGTPKSGVQWTLTPLYSKKLSPTLVP